MEFSICFVVIFFESFPKGLRLTLSLTWSFSGLCALPHMLHVDMYSQWWCRHIATWQDWQGSPHVQWYTCPTTAHTNQDTHATTISTNSPVWDACQWHWQVQPCHLPHHVHLLPPDVLDDLPKPCWWCAWWHGLSQTTWTLKMFILPLGATESIHGI